MKAAILITGYFRSFKLNLPNLEEKILSKFENIDIFLHITKDETQDKYLNENNSEDVSDIIKTLHPKVILFEDNLQFVQNPRENDLYNTWNKMYKLNKLKNEYEDVYGDYDVVIRYRPDTNIVSEIDFNKSKLVIPIDSKIDSDKLTNFDDDYVCDIFAYGDSKSMDHYFSMFEELPKLIESYGDVSETLLYHHLKNIEYEKSDINYNVILSTCNTFAICGDSGSGKTTLGERLKKYFSKSFVLECDRYHKWERGDKNWDTFTHLNPEANYLTKMNDDIFDLKVGNDIYQVDYDHSSGKFTQKEKIESPDNLIVCGLHSLYNSNDNIYNLKIFMDTEFNLRKKWKIKRDTKKRGYTMEKITKQINDRQSDYKKYIEAQRDKSDIIINFYEDTDENLKLKLYTSNRLPIEAIVKKLFNEGVDFQLLEDGDNFNVISFNSYSGFKRTPYYNQYNDYYDYIIFVIMSLNKKI